MAGGRNSRDSAVREALKKLACSVEETGCGNWGFTLLNGKPHPGAARTGEGWLLLDLAASAGAAHKDFWSLLRLSSRLTGLSKIAVSPGVRSVRLCAEIPLDDEVDLFERLREALAGFQSGLAELEGEKTGDTDASGPIVRSGGLLGSEAAGLGRLCQEAGWQFKDRSSGKVAIDLETRRGFYQAIVDQPQDSGVVVSVVLGSCDSLSKQCREAIAILLLRTNGFLRMARAAVAGEPDQQSIQLDSRFRTTPSAAELNHALSALSVGCQMCAEEVKALQCGFAAECYLGTVESQMYFTKEMNNGSA